MLKSWSWTVLWRPTRPFSTNTPKRCPFHYRGLECKNRKSRNTWGNRQIWPWNMEWSRANANRVLPREFSSVQLLSRVRLFATPWIAARQAFLTITNSQSSLRLTSIQSVMPSSHLILCRPLLLLPQSLPASESFPMSQLFAWGGQSTGVSPSASFLPKKSRADLLQNGLVGFPCSPRDSQESSPTPQFKSINSSALSLLHSPTLTSIHNHRKNHSLD